MALTVPEPPAASRQSLQAGLQRISATDRGAAFAMAGGAPPNVSVPQQLFVMGLDDLAHGGSLDAARGTGWRYLLTKPPAMGGTAVAAAEVHQVGNEHHFAQLQQGYVSEETRQAINMAQALPQVAGGNYELRALRIPALMIDAVWLKDKTGDNDLVLPVHSNVPTLTDGQAYSEKDFLDRLRDAAAKKRAFNDRPQRA